MTEVVSRRDGRPKVPNRPRFDAEGEDASDPGFARAGIRRGIGGDLLGDSFNLAEVETELVPSSLDLSRPEECGRASSVSRDAPWLPFSDLDPRGSELDQAAKDVRRRPFPAMRMPERFPRFVGFPIITGVEQGDSAKVRDRVVPCLGRDGWLRLMTAASGVTQRRTRRMWPRSFRDVRIRGERLAVAGIHHARLPGHFGLADFDAKIFPSSSAGYQGQ